jgi:hypothetical protein
LIARDFLVKQPVRFEPLAQIPIDRIDGDYCTGAGTKISPVQKAT